MATVHVTLNNVQALAMTGTTVEVGDSQPIAAKTVESSGTSTEVAGITGHKGQFWEVTATGNIFVACGANPTAGQNAGHLVLAGQSRSFAVTVDGEEIAIKDA